MADKTYTDTLEDGSVVTRVEKDLGGGVYAPQVVIASTQTAVPVTQSGATATVTQVASSASSVTLQAANAARKGLIIVNDSTSLLYVKFGAGASSTSYSLQLAAGQTYEAPTNIYTGLVAGIWVTANGNGYITETS